MTNEKKNNEEKGYDVMWRGERKCEKRAR